MVSTAPACAEGSRYSPQPKWGCATGGSHNDSPCKATSPLHGAGTNDGLSGEHWKQSNSVNAKRCDGVMRRARPYQVLASLCASRGFYTRRSPSISVHRFAARTSLPSAPRHSRKRAERMSVTSVHFFARSHDKWRRGSGATRSSALGTPTSAI